MCTATFTSANQHNRKQERWWKTEPREKKIVLPARTIKLQNNYPREEVEHQHLNHRKQDRTKPGKIY